MHWWHGDLINLAVCLPPPFLNKENYAKYLISVITMKLFSPVNSFLGFRIECKRVWSSLTPSAITNGLLTHPLFYSSTRKTYLRKRLRNHRSQYVSLSMVVCIYLRQLDALSTKLLKQQFRWCHVSEMWTGRESFCHILCHCPALAGHRMEIFSSAWIEQWFWLQLWGKGTLKDHNEIRGAQCTQMSVSVPGLTGSCPPKSQYSIEPLTMQLKKNYLTVLVSHGIHVISKLF
jgi:hypothetical protein